MRTHEHALISLAYVGGVALLAGQGLSDPWLYLSALLGGEILDFIDHPLYHLVYQRSEPHVVKAREIFFDQIRRKGWREGWRSASAYLNDVEDKRQFKGLLLHNFLSLTIAMLFGIVGSLFLQASIYLFVFFGALLLHMLCDVFGDFVILGHADNWLWIVPDSWMKYWAQQGNNLVKAVFRWVIFIPLGFLLVTIRWGWQLSNPDLSVGIYYHLLKPNYVWLPYTALMGMIYYLAWLVIICVAAVHKYRLEMKQDISFKRVPFSLGSVNKLNRFLKNKKHFSFEQVYLYMQADQAIWVLIASAVICIVLLLLTWLQLDNNFVFFLCPIFLALFFGTFLHTTVGEFGGVYGVLSAWLMDLSLGHLGLIPLWPISRGYTLFGAAITAWLLGLFGAIFLKGLIRMSVVVFSVEVQANSNSNDVWIRDLLNLAKDALQSGYTEIHCKLYGCSGNNFLRLTPVNLMIIPYEKRPMLGTDYYHIQASDSYAPIRREMAYVLFGDRLTEVMKKSKIVGEYGPLPVMPRYRTSSSKVSKADVERHGDEYYWYSNSRDLTLYSPLMKEQIEGIEARSKLIKTWAEFLDNLVTRKSTFYTDLFVYPSHHDGTAVICGITRERTSTKEYATVEAEAYAGSVMRKIVSDIHSSRSLDLMKCISSRIIFPRVSTFDVDWVRSTLDDVVLPVNNSFISWSDFNLIKKSLESLPATNILPHATADFSKKLVVLVLETAITTLIAAIGFNADLLHQIISNFFK